MGKLVNMSDQKKTTQTLSDLRGTAQTLSDLRETLSGLAKNMQTLSDLSTQTLSDQRETIQTLSDLTETTQTLYGLKETVQTLSSLGDTIQTLSDLKEIIQTLSSLRETTQTFSGLGETAQTLSSPRETTQTLEFKGSDSGELVVRRLPVTKHLEFPLNLSISTTLAMFDKELSLVDYLASKKDGLQNGEEWQACGVFYCAASSSVIMRVEICTKLSKASTSWTNTGVFVPRIEDGFFAPWWKQETDQTHFETWRPNSPTNPFTVIEDTCQREDGI